MVSLSRWRSLFASVAKVRKGLLPAPPTKGGKMNKQVAQGELLGRGGRRCCVLELNITTIWRS
eukprot:4643531-Amphidinium_carterae.2